MIEDIINRLSRVKRTGTGRWIACCPAHEDRTPSMTLREMPDGRILIHCFGGCSTDEVLGALGLTFDALFPEKLADHLPRQRRPFNASDVLEAVSHEMIVVAVAGSDLAKGRALSEIDHARLLTAIGRITAASELCNG